MRAEVADIPKQVAIWTLFFRKLWKLAESHLYTSDVELDLLLNNARISSAKFATCSLDFGCCLVMPERKPVTMHVVLEGKGTVSFPNGELSFRRRNAIVIPGNMRHSFLAGTEGSEAAVTKKLEAGESRGYIEVNSPKSIDDPVVILCSQISAEVGVGVDLLDGLDQPLLIDLDENFGTASGLDRLIEENNGDLPGSETVISALTTVLLTDILRFLISNPGTAELWWTKTGSPELAQVVAGIVSNPANSFNLTALASEALMSKTAFSKKFTQELGLSPMAFIHQVRLNKSAQLLEDTNESIDSIAKIAGFGHRSNFSRSFRQHFLVSPSDYRKSKLHY